MQSQELEKNLDNIWQELSQDIQYEKLELKKPEAQKEDHIRFVFISDTHQSEDWQQKIDDGDVLIHCGDFTMYGAQKQSNDFLEKFVKLPHKIQILIAGNHELTFDTQRLKKGLKEFYIFLFWFAQFKDRRVYLEERYPYLKKVDDVKVKENITKNQNIIYLENSSVEIYGYQIYGSPHTPYIQQWAFMERRWNLDEIWQKIPGDTEILVTHGPPLGFGDIPGDGKRYGCENLLNHVNNRVQPLVHAYGHIHGGYGMYTNGQTLFVNSATCNQGYQAENQSLVVDLKQKS